MCACMHNMQAYSICSGSVSHAWLCVAFEIKCSCPSAEGTAARVQALLVHIYSSCFGTEDAASPITITETNAVDAKAFIAISQRILEEQCVSSGLSILRTALLPRVLSSWESFEGVHFDLMRLLTQPDKVYSAMI